VPQLTTSRVPLGFDEATAPANGITMNYVRGGTGPTLVLLHGYPQTWYMWRKVLPAMAEHFTVIAPDLRGAGGSDAPARGYTKSGLAEDVHDLLVRLGLAEQVSVVGHDIGTMVAYAYAAAHRDSTSRLVLIEAPLADETLYQLPSLTPQGPGLWNFGFFTLQNGLPERMLAGREDTWVDGFVDWLEVVKGGVDEQAIAEYAAQLRPARAHARVVRLLPRDARRRRRDHPPPRHAADHSGAGDRGRGHAGADGPRPGRQLREQRHR